jgi:Mlc titration factor MtfA (ptsG expression regulator)/Flp pilus assembly protein TadD
MIFSWLKNQRRNRLLAEPIPWAWLEYLRRNVRHYQRLDGQRRSLVGQVARILVAEKNWVGGAGLDVTEEMKVTVAAQAAVLVLGLEEPYYFDEAQSIIVYRGPYQHPAWFQSGLGVIREGVPVSGEMWRRGPIVLSWRDVLAGGRNKSDGRNVVFHEFAHYLDGLDGDMEGTPPLAGRQRRETWYRVTEAEYLRLVGQARRDEVTLLDHYGATSRAEFFAVATECFFERPGAMQREHGELYGLLRDFYRQDPARWLPDAKVADPGQRTARSARLAAEVRRYRQERLAVLGSGDPGALFTLAVEYFIERRYALAARAATRVIALAPDDGEAYQYRAMARVKLGRYAQALADADEALRRDPGDADAYRARGAAYVGLMRYALAKQDLDRVLDENQDDAEARFYRGRVWMGLGYPRRAMADYARSLSIRPLVAEVYYHSGLANQAIGDRHEAEADLAKAFQLDPLVDRRT